MHYIFDLIKNILLFVGCILCFHYLFSYFKEFFKKENTNLEQNKTYKYKSILNEIKENIKNLSSSTENNPTITKRTNNILQYHHHPEHEQYNKKELYEFMKKIETIEEETTETTETTEI